MRRYIIHEKIKNDISGVDSPEDGEKAGLFEELMRISSRDRISTDATSRRVRAAKSKGSTAVRLELSELLVLISPNQRDRGFEQRLYTFSSS